MDAVRTDPARKVETLYRFNPIPEKGLGLFLGHEVPFAYLFLEDPNHVGAR